MHEEGYKSNVATGPRNEQSHLDPNRNLRKLIVSET